MIKKVTPTYHKSSPWIITLPSNQKVIQAKLPCVCWIDDDYINNNGIPIAGFNVMVAKFSTYKEYYDCHIDVELMKDIQINYQIQNGGHREGGHRAPKDLWK